MLSVPERHSTTPQSADTAAFRQTPLRLTVLTTSGQGITAGVGRIVEERGGRWGTTLSRLDQPGVVAAMYFTSGLREVIVRTDDGREAMARISGTSFAGSERICSLTGIGPFVAPLRRTG